MYGFIWREGNFDWWVKLNQKDKSSTIILCEEFMLINHKKYIIQITEYSLLEILNDCCKCPKIVKRITEKMHYGLEEIKRN